MDICRVSGEGEAIGVFMEAFSFQPGGKKTSLGGKVDTYYRDASRTVHQTGGGAELLKFYGKISFAQSTWTKDLDGEALALVSVRF